jgi:SLOG-like protein/TIR domain-containing protein
MDPDSDRPANKTAYEWSPLRVCVVWNPAFTQGPEISGALYEWFGGPDRELHRAGLGIPVQALSTTDSGIVPPFPPKESQQVLVVIPLIDAEFAGRTQWRNWVDELVARFSTESTEKIVILPWAIHPAAVRISAVSKGQVLGSGQCDLKRFCRLATEACALALLGQDHLQIFISYARSDANEIAGTVRRVLYEYGHIAAFLDEHDIRPGENWHEKLRGALREGAAMLAIVSDAYASRPWCREELRRFREPRRESRTGTFAANWWLPPVFILDDLRGRATRSMFEVGSAPAARWNPDRALEIVDQLIRDILIAAQQRARAKNVGQMMKRKGPLVINWVPDTWTLLVLRKLTGLNKRLKKVIYPGDGLPKVELERLQSVFGDIRFRSFEEELFKIKTSGRKRAGTRRVVVFSVSKPLDSDLLRRGFTPAHLDDLVLRVARLVLRWNADVAYGGQPMKGFTSSLKDDSGTVVLEPRLINYLGWPWADKLTSTQIANDLGACRYVKIECPGEIAATASEENRFHQITAATYTRRAILDGPHTDLDGKPIGRRVAQVIFGGKLINFQGVLPGILEEAMIAESFGVGLFVIGGFGGAAEALARFLATTEPWPPQMLANYKSGEVELATMQKNAFEQLKERFSDVRQRKDLKNGLTWDENRELMQTSDGAKIVSLISKGISGLIKLPS